MNIIILAAGVGLRLYPLTKDTPKCLLEINNNETILDRTIKVLNDVDPNLKKNIIVGFEANKIIERIKDFNVIINPFFRITNSIASLWFSKDLLNDEVILINSDVCFNESIFSRVLKHDNGNFVVVDSSKKCTDADYKVVTRGKSVINMGKIIPGDEYYGEYAGITRLNKKGALLLKKKIEEMVLNEEYDTWYETALVNLIKEGKLNLSYLDIKGEKWVEIDSSNDLERVKAYLILKN